MLDSFAAESIVGWTLIVMAALSVAAWVIWLAVEAFGALAAWLNRASDNWIARTVRDADNQYADEATHLTRRSS